MCPSPDFYCSYYVLGYLNCSLSLLLFCIYFTSVWYSPSGAAFPRLGALRQLTERRRMKVTSWGRRRLVGRKFSPWQQGPFGNGANVPSLEPLLLTVNDPCYLARLSSILGKDQCSAVCACSHPSDAAFWGVHQRCQVMSRP
jgi:hypothetical protein